MNPSNNDNPESLNLPKPQLPGAETTLPASVDRHDTGAPATAELQPHSGGAIPAAQTGALPPQPPAPVALPGHQPAATAPSDDLQALAADDADLIEKEWVTRAKKIVDVTRNDPHQQNKQISRVKAEYIKKRYNKDIKVSDS
jgi:hypothetical protein